MANHSKMAKTLVKQLDQLIRNASYEEIKLIVDGPHIAVYGKNKNSLDLNYSRGTINCPDNSDCNVAFYFYSGLIHLISDCVEGLTDENKWEVEIRQWLHNKKISVPLDDWIAQGEEDDDYMFVYDKLMEIENIIEAIRVDLLYQIKSKDTFDSFVNEINNLEVYYQE